MSSIGFSADISIDISADVFLDILIDILIGISIGIFIGIYIYKNNSVRNDPLGFWNLKESLAGPGPPARPPEPTRTSRRARGGAGSAHERCGAGPYHYRRAGAAVCVFR